MTNPLFLMQRYWGSDDSDADVEEDVPDKLEKVLKHAREKQRERRDSEASCHTTINGLVENDTSLLSCTDSNSPVKSKKRKKKNVKSSESRDFTEPDKEIQISKIKEKKRKKGEVSEGSTKTEDGNIQTETVKFSNEMETQSPANHPSLEHKSTNNKNDNNPELTNTDSLGLDPQDMFNQNSEIEDSTTIERTNDEDDYHARNNDVLFPVIKDVMNKTHENVSRVLPEWLANPEVIKIDVREKEKAVSELEFLDDCTKRNLEKCGIRYLFPVQIAVIPWLMRSTLRRLVVRPSDLCVSAPTGSGKTLAFVIPIIQCLKNRVECAIRALVVLPVGDLAVQVFKVFEMFCKGTELRVSLVIGQKSFLQEQSSLVTPTVRGYMNLADIVVCTPGRLIDHIDRTQGFSLNQLQFLVIDEADRMMEEIQQGWLKKVEKVVYKDHSPSTCACFSDQFKYHKIATGPSTACSFGHISEPLQKLLYSATLSQDPEKLHELALYRPKLFTTVAETTSETPESCAKQSSCQDEFIGKYTTPKSLLEYYIVCEPAIKPLMICHVIKQRQFKKVLCFTQSLEHSHRLYLVLSEMMDSTVRELSSNLRAVQRKIVLEQFASGKIAILVCSDLMARGMDIDSVDCVISYDMPIFIKKYIHRIGRTARAGKDGVAITLTEDAEVSKFKKMIVSAGKSPPSKLKIENSDLVPYEEVFKRALNSASNVITNEKRTTNILKRTSSKSFIAKKGKILNRKNNRDRQQNSFKNRK